MSGGLGSVLHGGRGSDFLAFDGAFGTAVLGPGRDTAGFYGDNARGRVRTEDGERDVVECLGRGSRLVVVDSDPRDRFDGRGGCVIVRDR